MNNVSLMGRITHKITLGHTKTNKLPYVMFTIAVSRRYDKNKSQQDADFIRCVAWNKWAEFISKYFSKGRLIAIEGRLHTRKYTDKNGLNHDITEVYVTRADFTGEAKSQNKLSQEAPNHQTQEPYQSSADYSRPTDDDLIDDDGVPF